MIEIQGQMFHGLDYHILDGCAFDDTKKIPQHPNTCTSSSQKTWPCTIVLFIWAATNHHNIPLVQSCNGIYMHTKHN
jgi:hypothetical protein